MKRQRNQGIDPIYSCTKNHKIPRNKSNQRGKKSENYRKPMKEIEEDTKIMEKDSMLLDRKNKYC